MLSLVQAMLQGLGVRGFVITFGFKKSTVESSRVGVGFRLFVDCKFGMISL